MPASALHPDIVVPGSTANLGAGFDALGLALALYMRARIVAHDPDGGPLRFMFQGGLLIEGENSIERALIATAVRYGTRLPGLDVEIASDIPLKAGLGSSAAAIVTGIRLYEALFGPLPEPDVLAIAGELEGHPDNTSASILGGLVASCQAEDGRVHAVASAWPEEVRVVVATPALGLATKRARGALPDSVSRADAIFNVQRAALLLQAVSARRFDVMREALRDRLHQPYRASLVPGLEQALAFVHPSLLGVFLSGAGPSIAALTHGDAPEIEELFRTLYARLGVDCAVRTLRVHQPTSTSGEPVAGSVTRLPRAGAADGLG